MRSGKQTFLISILVGLLLLCVPLAGALTLEEVELAIKKSGAEWNAKETSMSQMDPDIRRGRLMDIPANYNPAPGDVIYELKGGEKAKSSMDWRDYNGSNWMTSVKNQKYCGACAAFAAVATLEAQININNNDPSIDRDLSEQHLFSCGGGWCSQGMQPDDPLLYLERSGVPDEACFPYTAGDSGQDRYCSESCDDWRDRAVEIRSYTWYSSMATIKQKLASGPLSTFMEIYEDFNYYGGGVYQHTTGGYEGGHGVTLVGYNDSGQYWIVKNSWGPSWGESGYFRIAYYECSIAQYAAMLYVEGGSGDDDDDDDDDSSGRDCDGVCDKLVTCDYTSNHDSCMRACYDIRSTVFNCIDSAKNCAEVDDCMDMDSDDDEGILCEEICTKMYQCDLMEASDAMSCYQACLDDMKASVKECLDDAHNCTDVEACTGMSSGDDDDDDNDDNNDDGSSYCSLSSDDGGFGSVFLSLFLLFFVVFSYLHRPQRGDVAIRK